MSETEERTKLLRLVREVAAAASVAASMDQAFQVALEAICKSEGWDAGRVYQRSTTGGLTPGIGWPVSRPSKKRSAMELRPDAGNSIQDVLRTGKPFWTASALEARQGEQSKQAGPSSYLWIPLFASRSIVAVLEFCSREPISPDDLLLEALHNIGIQLGQVVERKELEKQVAEATDREQRRIGEELHDGLGQQISGLAMMATMLTTQLEKEKSPHAATMRKLLEAAEQAKVQARALTKGLVPVELDGHGLMAALQELCDSVRKMHGVECVFHCERPVVIQDSFTARHLYHIGQEAVHNAVKHGQPQRIDVSLSGGAKVTLKVRDNGNGFPRPFQDMEGQGLRLMRYRAGLIGASLEAPLVPKGGVEVICIVPQRAV